MGWHRFFGRWSHACEQQMVQQLAMQCQLASASAMSGAVEGEKVGGQETLVGRDARHEAVICTKADVAGNALGTVVNIARATALPILCVLFLSFTPLLSSAPLLASAKGANGTD